jgi:Bacterial protein of unknown function (DUF885)
MPTPPADDPIDRFLTGFYRWNPVTATFVGRHDHDHRLPDASDGVLGDRLAWAEHQLAVLDGPHAGPVDRWDELDRTVATGQLRIERWELGSAHGPRGNPTWYTGEAIFGLLSLFLTPFAPMADRVAAAVERLESVGRFLAEGRTLVRQAPWDWTARAIRECGAALALLGDGIDRLLRDEGIVSPALRQSADRARIEFGRHRHALETELGRRRTTDWACGEEALALLLTSGHFLETSADAIVAYAEAELASATGQLAAGAAALGAATPGVALERLTGIHPPVERYLDRYRELWDEVRARAETDDLVTWPALSIRFVPRPRWLRVAAPDLYFLFYRSPAAFQAPAEHEYLVTPIEPTFGAEQREALLRANNDSVMKLNHVIHHGSIGHHLQNWHATRSPSRIGRIAAIDGASRIAMLAGGTMAEGWACYATDLMAEVGLLTPLERLAERQARRRMCARAVVDVRLHQGRFTLDDATGFYEQRAGMSPRAASAEAIKNSLFPGTGLMYLMGTDTIHRLRRDLSARREAEFRPKTFHDEFLRYGSLPVVLVAADLLAGTDASQP